jgi:hypothetical protein
MARPHISLAGLMGFVLVCGLGAAGLRFASETWVGSLLLLTLTLLAIGILGVVYRRREARAVWLGFSLFGWGYLALTFGPWFATELQPKLPTTKLLAHLYERLEPTPAGDLFASGRGTVTMNAGSMTIQAERILLKAPASSSSGAAPDQSRWTNLGGSLFVLTGTVGNFCQVGHCLLTMIAALVGALIARRFYATGGFAG